MPSAQQSLLLIAPNRLALAHHSPTEFGKSSNAPCSVSRARHYAQSRAICGCGLEERQRVNQESETPMKPKAMVIVALVFSAVVGYSMHGVVPKSPPAKVSSLYVPDQTLERLWSHLEHAKSIYAMLFKSRCPEGEKMEITFRGTLEELTNCRRELQEDPDQRYSDFRIAHVTAVLGQSN